MDKKAGRERAHLNKIPGRDQQIQTHELPTPPSYQGHPAKTLEMISGIQSFISACRNKIGNITKKVIRTNSFAEVHSKFRSNCKKIVIEPSLVMVPIQTKLSRKYR